ncbi:MAG: peroxiredoxin [Leptospirales bacterium]
MLKKIIIVIAILMGGVIMAVLVAEESSPAKYSVGDLIEKYEVTSDDGSMVVFPVEKWTVLYFYPMDDTPGCTTQAKTFTSLYDEYDKAGIVVFGVNMDSVESHRKFKEKHALKVTLLSDPKGNLARDFGVNIILGMCSRDAVIIDPHGRVDAIHRGVSPKGSPYEIIEYIISK